MADYQKLLDPEIWAFITRTNAFYPEDTASRSIAEQRAIYDEMCAQFRQPRPSGLPVDDRLIANVPVRVYGAQTQTRIVYFHGGGFVVGGLESHDDICAEIAAATGRQLISVDYRLGPEHLHPAAFEDALAVVSALLEQGEVVLAGDSAGGNLAACVVNFLGHKIKGQVLIYPSLAKDMSGESYEEHAHAPMLTRADVAYYGGIRGGDRDDPSLVPMAGALEQVPPSVIFPAECDPLASDGAAYAERVRANGGIAHNLVQSGLVHGHLRARHSANRASEAFDQICAAIAALAEGRWVYE